MGSINLSILGKASCCCCGFSLQVGSLIIAWIALVFSVFGAALCILRISILVYFTVWETLTILGIIWFIVSSLFSLLLLFGISQRKAAWMKPGIALHSIFIFLLCLSNVFWISNIFTQPELISALLISVLIAGMNFHWLQVLVSYYLSISRPTTCVV